jgi:2',3'-cyclic-nucleotide 2'-phosphodiesterase (5'-nucleotidase family)
MRRFTVVAVVLTALLVAIGALSGAAAGKPDEAPGQAKKSTTTLQILTISDWHGQLTPLDVDPGSATVLAGGAAFLKTYLDEFRAANPNTLTFMAGDSFGATPPISNFFEDEPAVLSQRMMGVSADTLGNHNFDRGVTHLQRMVNLAAAPTSADRPGTPFPYLSANLENVEDNVTGIDPWRMFDVGGVKVAVIGITNEEAPELVFPGSFGTIEITDSVRAANKAAIAAKKAGADVVIVLTHKGIRGFNADGSAFGELVDFANGVAAGQIDLIVGDHTDFTYSGVHQERILVVENRSKGIQFAQIELAVDDKGKVVSKSVKFHTPINAGKTPDPVIQAYIDKLNAQLQPILGRVIGSSSKPILRSDSCGRSDSRLCESLVGNVVTDALRDAYDTAFAITNSGGLRDALTCPHVLEGGFCPASTPTTPPYPITRGGVIAVLRFGNVSATTELTGAELKTFLEHGVSSMPGANGRFPQVSGLCFTYNIEAAAGSRVTSVVRQAADGSCTGSAVDLTATSSYTVTSNDFTLSGGDGYPNVISKSTTRNIMSQDLEAYVAAGSPLNPTIQGRIVCTDPNPGAGANCPAITAP